MKVIVPSGKVEFDYNSASLRMLFAKAVSGILLSKPLGVS